MRSARPRPLVFLALTAAVGLIAPGCSVGPVSAEINSRSKSGSEETQLTPSQAKGIEVAPAGEVEVSRTLLAAGKVAFHDLKTSHVFSPVTGRITKVLAQPGQRVKRGSPLLTIVSPDVGLAFSDLLKAKADFDQSKHELDRQKELFAGHATSERDLETAEDNHRKAAAELERAEKKARLLKKGTEFSVSQAYTLPSPIDGEVIARFANPGVEVQGLYTGGNPIELFTIGEIDEVWLYADVPEAEIARIKQGADVSVKVIAFPNRTFSGKVDWVSAVLDPNFRTAKVRCTIENKDRLLKPEMYAQVEIAATGFPSLAIPRSAIVRLGEQTMVYVDRGKTDEGMMRYERLPVVVDEEEKGDFVPVKRGLVPGDRVVIKGAQSLNEGT